MPLARSGLPYATQAILHLLIAWGAAAVFLTWAPFRLPVKALFLVSFYPLYEYAVVARSYSLGILLTFCLLALHVRRESYLFVYAAMVALLYNVNAHSVGVAGALTVLFAIDVVPGRRRDTRHVIALAIMLAGLVLAFVQLYTPGSLVPDTVVSAPDLGAFLDAASRAFLPWYSEPSKLWGIVALGTVAFAIRKSAAALVFYVGSLGGLALIFTYLWVGGYRHYGLILIAAAGSMWLAGDIRGLRATTVANVLLYAALALSIPMGVQFLRADVTQNFSGSGEMAGYLTSHGLEAKDIAAHPPAHTEAVLAHLRPRTFWYAALGTDGSYMKWDRAQQIAQAKTASKGAAAAAAHFRDREWLYLTTAGLSRPEQYGLTLVYATHEPLMQATDAPSRRNDEQYWLYRTFTPAFTKLGAASARR